MIPLGPSYIESLSLNCSAPLVEGLGGGLALRALFLLQLDSGMSIMHLSAFQPLYNEQVEYLHLQKLLGPA